MPEHKRVLAAVSDACGDWHTAFHAINHPTTLHKGGMSWSTFCQYAGSRTDTYTVREDDAHTDDVADLVVRAMVADDTPDTDKRVLRVQEAVHALPRRQFEAVVRWSVLAQREVKVRVVRGSKRADTLADEMTESEMRNFNRARESLRTALADLATGAHVLRAPRELTPDPQNPHVSGAPMNPVTTRWGDPLHGRPSTLPPGFWESQAFWSAVNRWDSEWVASVPPVPRNWHTLPAGTPWRLEHEYSDNRRKGTKPQISSIQNEDFQ
ncbi:hypothetical protein PP1_005490 [Pseudonocardia sp. P1]